MHTHACGELGTQLRLKEVYVSCYVFVCIHISSLCVYTSAALAATALTATTVASTPFTAAPFAAATLPAASLATTLAATSLAAASLAAALVCAALAAPKSPPQPMSGTSTPGLASQATDSNVTEASLVSSVGLTVGGLEREVGTV